MLGGPGLHVVVGTDADGPSERLGLVLSGRDVDEVQAKLGVLGDSLPLELLPRDTIRLELMREVSLHGSNPSPAA